jgi:hypothetical protein
VFGVSPGMWLGLIGLCTYELTSCHFGYLVFGVSPGMWLGLIGLCTSALLYSLVS